jgi:hypothetical protein
MQRKLLDKLPGKASEQYFSTLSHKGHDFRKKKKVIERKTSGLIWCTTFV